MVVVCEPTDSNLLAQAGAFCVCFWGGLFSALSSQANSLFQTCMDELVGFNG